MPGKEDEILPGLTYETDVLSESAEQAILAFLARQEWEHPVFYGKAAKRQVLQFGYTYPYGSGGRLTPAAPIPDELRLPGIPGDQLIVNKYEHGQRISAHTDHTRMFGKEIVCVTLGARGVMQFSRAGHKSHSLSVARRSAYRMRGDARYRWKHAMKPHSGKVPRISLTYRTVNPACVSVS